MNAKSSKVAAFERPKLGRVHPGAFTGAWLALTAAAGGAVAGAALLTHSVWPGLVLGAILGGAALLVTWPLGPFLLLQAAALSNHYTLEVGPVSVRAEHVATIVMAGLLAIMLWHKRRRPVVTTAGWLALAWWGMNVLATMVNALDPRDSFRHIVRLGLMVMAYLVVVNLLVTPRAWRLAVAGFLVLGVLESAYGLVTMALWQLGYDLGLMVHRHIPIPIPYGTLQEGNIFGSHSASWAATLMWLTLARWRSRWRPWLVAGLLITLAATLFSFGRGAWLAIGVCGVIAFIFFGRSLRGRWQRLTGVGIGVPLVLVLVIGVAVLAPAETGSPVGALVGRLRTFGQLMSDATFAARLDDYGVAFADWLQHPWIGWGPGTFYQLHGMRRWEAAWITNLILRTLQETGVFGLLFFLGFSGMVLAEAIAAARRMGAATGGAATGGAATEGTPLLSGVSEGEADRALLLGLALGFTVLLLAYQATDGVWLAAFWIHAGLLTSGARALRSVAARNVRRET